MCSNNNNKYISTKCKQQEHNVLLCVCAGKPRVVGVGALRAAGALQGPFRALPGVGPLRGAVPAGLHISSSAPTSCWLLGRRPSCWYIAKCSIHARARATTAKMGGLRA